MNESTEIVVSDFPYVVRRIIRWSDCDPAGVVYIGRFTDYLLDAAMHFLRHLGHGAGTAAWNSQKVQFPGKHMSLTFHVSLYPEDVVDIHIRVGAIRTRTFDLLAHAYLPDGRMAFEGVLTPICIHKEVRESTPLPHEFRAALEPYLLSGKEK